MTKSKIGLLLVLAVLALVSVASAALPASVTANINPNGLNSYFDVDVTSGGNFDLPTANNYLGWCADSKIAGVGSGNTYVPYDSRGALPPMHSVNWNKVNYIINHKNGKNKYAVQQAIWYFDHGRVGWGVEGSGKDYLESDVQALIDDADANGGSYVPTLPGEKYMVIMWKAENVQPVVIEVPIPDIPVPEFPTLALPIAMMIGVVGAVQYIRTREE